MSKFLILLLAAVLTFGPLAPLSQNGQAVAGTLASGEAESAVIAARVFGGTGLSVEDCDGCSGPDIQVTPCEGVCVPRCSLAPGAADIPAQIGAAEPCAASRQIYAAPMALWSDRRLAPDPWPPRTPG